MYCKVYLYSVYRFSGFNLFKQPNKINILKLESFSQKLIRSDVKGCQIQFETEEQNCRKSNKHLKKYSMVTQKILEHLKKDLKKDDLILDMFSDYGDGSILKSILFNLPNHVISYNSSEILLNVIKSEFSEHLDRLTISELSLNNFYIYLMKQKLSPISVDIYNLINEISKLKKDNSTVCVVVAKPFRKFYSHLTNSFCNRRGLYESLNPTWYVVVPHKICFFLSGNIQNRSLSKSYAILKIYFDIEYLGCVSRNLQEETLTSSNQSTKNLFREYFLIKIVPNMDIFDRVSDSKTFDFYLNIMLRLEENSTAINAMEKYIPDVGLDFILNRFKTLCHPSTFTREDWYKAFHIFSNHPAFPGSFFYQENERNWKRYGYFKKVDNGKEEIGDDGLCFNSDIDDHDFILG